MTNCSLCYVTFKDESEAKAICHTLLDEKLIACANLMSGMTAIYSWKGQTETATEISCFLKTSDSRLKKLEQRYLELHSYETPCFIVIDIKDGTNAYLDWLKETVKD